MNTIPGVKVSNNDTMNTSPGAPITNYDTIGTMMAASPGNNDDNMKTTQHLKRFIIMMILCLQLCISVKDS